MNPIHLMIIGFSLAFVAKIMQDRNRRPDSCPLKQGTFGVALNMLQLNRPSALNPAGKVWLVVGASGLVLFVGVGVTQLANLA